MTHLWILAASVVLNVCGQISIKQSILNFQDSAGGTAYFGMATALPILTAPLTLLGLVLYAVSAVFWISALSRVELSYAYPMLGAGYILVSIVAWKLWGEAFGVQRLIGTLVVALGVILVGTSK
jgi:multidrug transporter EmrE-like cation transporter